MKTLLTSLTVVAALTLTTAAFAGPNTGQPSHAQRIMQLNQHREAVSGPYALTGEREGAEVRNYRMELRSSHVGAQRSHRVYVRVPVRDDMGR